MNHGFELASWGVTGNDQIAPLRGCGIVDDLPDRTRRIDNGRSCRIGHEGRQRLQGAAAVHAIRKGGLAIVPTDTVYGLAANAYSEGPVRRLYRAKGREEIQPTALVAASVDWLLECVPELRGRSGTIARALLPGLYTLVLPNPAQRFPWLGGEQPGSIGVRVPALEGPGRVVLDAAGAIVATSANLPGEADPRRLDDVPAQIREGVAAIVDGGELSGIPSTVIDLTTPEARVLRAGAGDVDDALARIAALS
jgi:L-threonylcarbamoyladenylate synthase